MTRIPLARPLFGPEEARAVAEALESGWVMQGPRVADFEARVAAAAGVPHAVACASGTAALHLGLWALGVGRGDEVIVPALTFVATAHAVELCGGHPVFVDVDAGTWCMDVDAARRARTPRTRAVVPVHLFGLPMDIRPLRALRVPVLEDAAGALGAVAPPQGDAAAFSFHPRKVATMGEGGVIATARDDVAARVRALRNQGRAAQAGGFQVGEYVGPGTNYRLTDLQAAVGVCQMERLPALLSARRARALRYRERLAGLPLELPPEATGHGYQAFVVLVGGRDKVLGVLAEEGVEAAPGTHSIPALPYYHHRYALDPSAFPVAARVHARGLALPLYPQMTDEEQDRVVEALGRALG
jgi:perosamine synthetase